nr:cell division cycle 5-like protein [Quercus suber]
MVIKLRQRDLIRLELKQFSGQRSGKPSSRWTLPQRSLNCFKALQKQEQLAASHRIDSIWKEVPKQKELEQTLQRRYGDLVAELEKMQQAQKQEEIAAKNHALESSKAAEDQTVVQSVVTDEPIPSSEEQLGSSIPCRSSNDENAGQQMDVEKEHPSVSLKPDMDADGQKEHPQPCMDENLQSNMP